MLLLRWDCWAPNVILKSALVLAIEPVGAAQQTANYVIRLQNASPVWSISWTSPVWSRRSMNHSMLKQHWWVGEVLVTKSRISAQSGFAHCMHKLNPAFWISFIIFIVILFILKLKVGSPSFVLSFSSRSVLSIFVADIHTARLLARSAKPSDVGFTMTLCTPASSGHCDIRNQCHVQDIAKPQWEVF